EINARVTPGKRVRQATFRLDYSYSLLDNLIVVSQNRYVNSGRRGIHSVEFLGRANLTGDHIFQMGYSFVDINEQGKGLVLSVPNHWFTMLGSINLLPNRLDLISTVLLAAATQDPD